MVEGEVDAVDLNLGCPQGIARRGHYGAFLLDDLPLLRSIVATLHDHLTIPITCKIRLLPSLPASLTLALTLQAAGASVLTVHGRTKENIKDSVGPSDWAAIAAIKRALHIPVIANGGVASHEDVRRCLEETGVDAVMSAEGVLAFPYLFSPLLLPLPSLPIRPRPAVPAAVRRAPPPEYGHPAAPVQAAVRAAVGARGRAAEAVVVHARGVRRRGGAAGEGGRAAAGRGRGRAGTKGRSAGTTATRRTKDDTPLLSRWRRRGKRRRMLVARTAGNGDERKGRVRSARRAVRMEVWRWRRGGGRWMRRLRSPRA